MIFAQGYGNGEAPCIARWSALAAGLPISVPGYQLDRRCGSGLQAVIDAAMMVQTGAADVVVAGGVESMSNAEYYTTDMRGGARAGSVTLHDRLARGRVMSQPISRFGVISRHDRDRRQPGPRLPDQPRGLRRIRRRQPPARRGGLGGRQVRRRAGARRGAPEARASRSCSPATRACAPTPRPRASGALRPLEKGGVVTAGNASQQNDAAAACLVVAEDKLAELDLEPDGLVRQLGGGRLRALAHGHRPGAGGGAPVRPHRPVAGTTSTWSNSTKPSPRRCWRCSRAGAGTSATA